MLLRAIAVGAGVSSVVMGFHGISVIDSIDNESDDVVTAIRKAAYGVDSVLIWGITVTTICFW